MKQTIEQLPGCTIPFLYGMILGILIVGLIWVMINDRDIKKTN